MSSKKCLDTLFEAASTGRSRCPSERGEVLHIIPSATSGVESMKAIFSDSNKEIDSTEQYSPKTFQQCQDMLQEEKSKLMQMRIKQSDSRSQVLQLLEDKRVLSIQLLYYKADLYFQKQQTRKWRQKYESLKRKRAANEGISRSHRGVCKSCSTGYKNDSNTLEQIKKKDMEAAANLNTKKQLAEVSGSTVEIKRASSIQTRSAPPSYIGENHDIFHKMESGKKKKIDETFKETPVPNISIPIEVKSNGDVPSIQEEVTCASSMKDKNTSHEIICLKQNLRIENVPNESLLRDHTTNENGCEIHISRQKINNRSWEEEHPHSLCTAQKTVEVSPTVQQCDSTDLSNDEDERDTDKNTAVDRHDKEQVFSKNLSPESGTNLNSTSSPLDGTGPCPRGSLLFSAESRFFTQNGQNLEGYEDHLTTSHYTSVVSEIENKSSLPEKDAEEQRSLADMSIRDELHPEVNSSVRNTADHDQIPIQKDNSIFLASENRESSSITSSKEERAFLQKGIEEKSLINEPTQSEQCSTNNFYPRVPLYDEISSIWQDPSAPDEANTTTVIKVGMNEEQVSSDQASYYVVQTSGELSSIWQDDSILFSTATSEVSEAVKSLNNGITDDAVEEPRLWVTMSRDRKAKRKFTPDIDTTANRSIRFSKDNCLINTETSQDISGFSDSLTADDLSENLSHPKTYTNFGNDVTTLQEDNVDRTPCSLSFSPDASELECPLRMHVVRKKSLEHSGNQLIVTTDNAMDTRSPSLNGSAILENITLSSSSEMQNDDSLLNDSISTSGTTSTSLVNISTLQTEALKKKTKRRTANVLFSSFQAPKLKSQQRFVTKRRR